MFLERVYSTAPIFEKTWFGAEYICTFTYRINTLWQQQQTNKKAVLSEPFHCALSSLSSSNIWATNDVRSGDLRWFVPPPHPLPSAVLIHPPNRFECFFCIIWKSGPLGVTRTPFSVTWISKFGSQIWNIDGAKPTKKTFLQKTHYMFDHHNVFSTPNIFLFSEFQH